MFLRCRTALSCYFNFKIQHCRLCTANHRIRRRIIRWTKNYHIYRSHLAKRVPIWCRLNSGFLAISRFLFAHFRTNILTTTSLWGSGSDYVHLWAVQWDQCMVNLINKKIVVKWMRQMYSNRDAVYKLTLRHIAIDTQHADFIVFFNLI